LLELIEVIADFHAEDQRVLEAAHELGGEDGRDLGEGILNLLPLRFVESHG